MASRSDIEAGRAFLKLVLKDEMLPALQKSLGKVGSSLQSAGRRLSSLGKRALFAGGAMSAPFIASIKAASDFEETMSKFAVVFGDSADDIKKWGDALAGQIGRAEGEVAKFLAANQDLFVPLGFAASEAENLSKQVAKLTFDLASFNNMSDADVHRDLQAALTGSGEVMKKYGVIVSEAAVKQELLNQGLDPKTASNQQKVQARLNIIMAGTTAAQGDALRTAGSFANQMKGLRGSLQDVAVEIGKALLPFVTSLVEKVREFAGPIKEFIANNSKTIAIVAALAAGITALGAILIAVGGTLALMGTAISGVATVIGFLLTPLGAGLAVVVAITAALAAGVAAWMKYTEAGQETFKILKKLFGDLWDIFKETFGDIIEKLASGDIAGAAEAAFEGMHKAIMKVLGAIGDTVKLMWNKILDFMADTMAGLLDVTGFNEIFKFVAGVDLSAKLSGGRDLSGSKLARKLAGKGGGSGSGEGGSAASGSGEGDIEKRRRKNERDRQALFAYARKTGSDAAAAADPAAPASKGTDEEFRRRYSPLVTFSASAAIAASFQGVSPQKKMADDVKESKEIAKEHLEIDKRFIEGLESGKFALTYGS